MKTPPRQARWGFLCIGKRFRSAAAGLHKIVCDPS
jgi:hypothetical protein